VNVFNSIDGAFVILVIVGIFGIGDILPGDVGLGGIGGLGIGLIVGAGGVGGIIGAVGVTVIGAVAVPGGATGNMLVGTGGVKYCAGCWLRNIGTY